MREIYYEKVEVLLKASDKLLVYMYLKKEIYIYMKAIHGKLRMVHTMVIVIMEEALFASGCKTLGYTIFLVLVERL